MLLAPFPVGDTLYSLWTQPHDALATTVHGMHPKQAARQAALCCGPPVTTFFVANEIKKEKIRTDYSHSGGATAMVFVVKWSHAVSSFVMRSPVTWNMAVRPPDDTTLAYRALRMSASHFIWKEMPWIPMTLLPMTFGWSNTSAKRKRSARQCGCSVWEKVDFLLVNFHSKCELGVVVQINAARFLYNIPNKLPLCGGGERVPLLSDDLCQGSARVTASQMTTLYS